MLSKIDSYGNPYGLGNVYQKPEIQQVQQQQTEVAIPQEILQEVQELPNLSPTALEIRKFSDGIKGANEMVGAMQIADITLNALSNQVKSSGENLREKHCLVENLQFL